MALTSTGLGSVLCLDRKKNSLSDFDYVFSLQLDAVSCVRLGKEAGTGELLNCDEELAYEPRDSAERTGKVSRCHISCSVDVVFTQDSDIPLEVQV